MQHETVTSQNILTNNLLHALGSRQFRQSLRRKKAVKHIIYHRKNKICFVLTTDDRVIAVVGSGAFLLEPLLVKGGIWRRRFNKIRSYILEGKIRDYNDLVAMCRPGITMSYIKLEWYV